jgi:predicted SAM-dependent methyltransferase
LRPPTIGGLLGSESFVIPKLAKSLRKRVNRLLGAPVKPEDLLRRKMIARAYLRGHGLEIGALHNPLKLPRHVRASYVDRVSHVDLAKEHPELRSKLVAVDIVDDGEALRNVPDVSQDFVIANHFVEHCENPIGALRNMLRVLKAGGVLFMAIPDKRYTFDAKRPVTPIEHLLRDDREGSAWSRRQHFEEWTRLVNGVRDPAEAERQIQELMEKQAPIHYHAWTQVELLELILTLRRLHRFEVELIFKRDNEVIFVLRKDPDDPVGAVAAGRAADH